MTVELDTILARLAGPDDPDLDLVVFPGAGAGPSAVARWRPVLPPSWRLHAVCLPGRGTRFGEPFATDPALALAEVTEAISRRCTAPLVLVGHSVGALWAHDAASRITTAMLVTAGCEPPDPGGTVAIHPSTEEEDLHFTRELLVALGVDDEETLAELAEISVPIMRADVALAHAWRAPVQPLDCPIMSYYGSDEPVPGTSWAEHTRASAWTMTVPGDHYFFQDRAAEVVADLAGRMAAVPV
jgi:surfactin synthase thioesterase subunit